MTKPIDMMLDGVKWVQIPGEIPHEDDVPYATHEGTLTVGEFQFHVYQLSDGRRVIAEEDVKRFFGLVK